MLSILTKENARTRVESEARLAGAPWALIKDSMYTMLDVARANGIFACTSDDQSTIDLIQGAITVQDKAAQIGPVEIMRKDTAKRHIDEIGRVTIGLMWSVAKKNMDSYVDAFYADNLWLCYADGANAELIRTKTQHKNVLIRLNLGEKNEHG